MTGDDFRRIALGMDGAIERSHMGHPDFRVNGRIFATLDDLEKRGMVKLTPEEQAEFMSGNPGIFVPAAGAWGRQGCTLVAIDQIDEHVLGEAVTLAWQAAVKATVAKTPKTRRIRRSVRSRTARRQRSAKSRRSKSR
jgi:hypothetical protein